MNIRKFGRFTIILICVMLTLLGVSVSTGFLFVAFTTVGRGLAFIGVVLSLLPILILGRWLIPSRRNLWRWLALISGGVVVGLSGIILFSTPDGIADSDSPVSHRFVGNNRFQRFAITNIIPESEQVNVGFLVAPYIDPIITYRQAQQVSDFTLELYQDMENDRHFHRLGSVMGWAYAELWRAPFNVGHYYLYIPKNHPAGPLPVILFLHGAGGNFKSYTWAWSKFAEEEGFIIVAPSFGFGNWSRDGSIEAAMQALNNAATLVEIDPKQIYLAGLSNGGLGVSMLGATSPEYFRGLIFLSPVMKTEVVDSSEFHAMWHGRPVLVITGQADQRVPVSYVAKRVSNLQQGEVDVTYIPYANEDHFLFFSQLSNVLNDISTWLSK